VGQGGAVNTEAHLLFNGLYESECPVCSKFVNSITQGGGELADTLSNTAAIPQPTGDAKMFTSSNFEMNVTKIIAAALVAAFVLTLVG
jgi:hypothetical protein